MGKAFTLDTTYINLRPDDSATTHEDRSALLVHDREAH